MRLLELRYKDKLVIEIDLRSVSALARNNINLDVWFHVRYTGEKEQFYVTKASSWFGFKIVLHGWTIRAFLKISSMFATVWPIEWKGMHFNFIVWCIYGITNVKETEQLGRVLLERFCREQIWTALLRIHVPIFIFCLYLNASILYGFNCSERHKPA